MNWEIKFEIAFPMDTNMEFNNPPEKLEPIRKFENGSTIEIDGVKIKLQESREKPEDGKISTHGCFIEPATLLCEINGTNIEEIVEKITPIIEGICDRLSFFSQHPILIYSCQIKCIEKPNEIQQFSIPPQPAKFLRTITLNTQTQRIIPLSALPADFGKKERAIMRWYHKAISAQYDIDRFAFLWICLEILSKIKKSPVKSIYTNRCGHEIAKCPKCGESTEKEVNGQTLQKFLTEDLYISEADAKSMWRFRQFLHGENDLTAKCTKHMGKLTTMLHAAVSLGIKRLFSLQDGDLPRVNLGGLSITSMAVHIQTE